MRGVIARRGRPGAGSGRMASRGWGSPPCILDHDYEDFPRGRIVYQCGTGIFILYADPRLHTPRSRARIRSRFHLERAKVRFARDAHYRRG